jgi:hypothetical protein
MKKPNTKLVVIALAYLLFAFTSCGEVKKEQSSTTKKPTRTKTIILLDVSISFKDYINKSYEKIGQYIDKVQLLEDVTLRKIGINEGDNNFIAELDLTNGFATQIKAILSPCEQYKKDDRDKCEQEKGVIVKDLKNAFAERKKAFKDKLASVSLVRDAKTDIITPINQCLRDFERTKYDKRRIIIFTDLDDETVNLKSFNLNIDSIKHVDEIFIFYAQEKFADLWRDKLKGKNVSINHIAITETSFNQFIEQIK